MPPSNELRARNVPSPNFPSPTSQCEIPLQGEPHLDQATALWRQTKSQRLGKLQHANILRECLAHQTLCAAPAAVANQLRQKERSKPLPFEIGANQHRNFRLHVIAIVVGMYYAQHLIATALHRGHGDERHVPLIVELRQMRKDSLWQLTHRRKESRAHVIRRDMPEKTLVFLRVLGPHRPQYQLAPVKLDALLKLRRIRPDHRAIGPPTRARPDGAWSLKSKDGTSIKSQWMFERRCGRRSH